MEVSREFRERFIKTLQGKDYVVYGGLLELARQRGLKRVTTEIVQIPNPENGMYAVVEAEVETQDGVYKEVGDASPDNVSKGIQPHLLRMAATRAKARALRDAVGIDMLALEELGDVLPQDEIPAPPKPEEIVIGFGKYARKTLGEILELDRGYMEWLRDNARDEVIRKAAGELLAGSQGRGEPGRILEEPRATH